MLPQGNAPFFSLIAQIDTCNKHKVRNCKFLKNIITKNTKADQKEMHSFYAK